MSKRWIKQTIFPDIEKGIYGNCAQAAVASLLHMSLDEVPHFSESGDSVKENELLENFFADQGFNFISMFFNYIPEGLYLASGTTIRGTTHMVVMRDGKLEFDPHPDNTGLERIIGVYILTPKDPAIVAGHVLFRQQQLLANTHDLMHQYKEELENNEKVLKNIAELVTPFTDPESIREAPVILTEVVKTQPIDTVKIGQIAEEKAKEFRVGQYQGTLGSLIAEAIQQYLDT